MSELKEARIFSLVVLPALGQYVVTLEDVKGDRLIPIWIGLNEGNAIVYKLQGEKPPRPLTHDLFAGVLQSLGIKLERVIVEDLRDNTYIAVLELRQGAKLFQVDSRPSDAMALAVRTESPIFIHTQVLEKCPEIKKPITEQEIDKFKQRLSEMRPEDFFKELQTGESPPAEPPPGEPPKEDA